MTKLLFNSLVYAVVFAVLTVLAAEPAVSQKIILTIKGPTWARNWNKWLMKWPKPRPEDNAFIAKRKRSIPEPPNEPMECVCSLPECFSDGGNPGHCTTHRGCFYKKIPYRYMSIDEMTVESTSSVIYGCLEMTNIKRSCTDFQRSQEFPLFGDPIMSLKKPLARTIFRCCNDKPICNKGMGLPDKFLTKEPAKNPFNLVYGNEGVPSAKCT